MKSLILFLFIFIVFFNNVYSFDLTVYYAIDDVEAKIIISEFGKRERVKVKGIRRSSAHLVKVIEAEKNNPTASVMFGGPITSYIQCKKKGLLEKYVSPAAKSYPQRFKDRDGYWTGIYLGVIGFATNSKKNIPPPKSWEELLKPVYKKKIAISNPAASGTAYTVLATLVQMIGKEKAFEYMKKLDEQISVYTKSGAEPAKLAGIGVVSVGICFAHDIIRAKREGVPLVLTFPEEGTGWEIGGVGLIKNAPNTKLAKKFIDFILSKQVQDLYSKQFLSPRFPTNPEAIPPKDAISLESIKLIKFNFEWAGENQEVLAEEWNRRIAAGR